MAIACFERTVLSGNTPYDTMRMALDGEPRNPRLWNPAIDLDLATICLKCLEKQPGKRYESAEAVAEERERRGDVLGELGELGVELLAKLLDRCVHRRSLCRRQARRS